MDKYIGRLLDNRYEILEVIGTGGMAVVYKARCHRLNRLVAIKILKDDYMQDEEFRRRFHSESQAVAMLSHPNIVSVYDVSSSVTADYIVMELIDGITLKQYMEKKGVLNWKETLHFAIQIGKALEHAHSRGIVHRDIKPHNVMVLKNGSVKVTDFGIARMMAQGNTLTKEALGSVHYISPEQAKGGRVDNRSDIYSLGVVMYEMMSGRPPYDGESPVAVAIQHINGGAPLPTTLNPNIPEGLEQIIMHAMALEPGGRYATATMMLTDMDEFRKNPGILFDYNIPGMGELLKPKKPPLLLEPDTPAETTAQREERKKNGEAPPVVTPPKRRPSGTGKHKGSGSNRTPSRTRQKSREPEKESNVATIAIIACAAVMVLAVVIFVIVLLGSGSEVEYVDIPQLIGMDYETAKNDSSLGVEIKISEKKYSTEYPAGQIMWQNPEAGGQIAKGSTIAVNVSLGEEPAPVMMPEILGWEQGEVERALNNLGIKLNIKIVEENHDEIEAGKVIRTEPVAKEQLTENQEVIIVISLGMEHKTALMLDVVGYTRENAEKALKSQPLNLDLVFEEVFSSEVESGCVVSTDPEAEMEISTGQTIIVKISRGPELKAVPDVLGSWLPTAKKMIEDDGFKTPLIQRIPNAKEKDTVIDILVNEATIKPGEKVDVNTQITIVVSDGPNGESGVKKTIYVDLSEDFQPPCKMVVKLGEETVFEYQIDNEEQEKVPVELIGTGKQTYDVYINNSVYMKLEVDFTN